MCAVFKKRHELVVDRLGKVRGFECPPAQGAFYMFPNIETAMRLRGAPSDVAFCEQLLESTDVAVVPGSAFGPSGAGHVRMCYATSYEQLEEALGRIGRFTERVRAA